MITSRLLKKVGWWCGRALQPGDGSRPVIASPNRLLAQV
jgi:hypothetical protein